METPRTNAALDETLKGCGYLKGNVHGPLTDLCRKLECENAELRKTLLFVRDECDWETPRGDFGGGGDDRIGPAITSALANSISETRRGK